LIDYEREVFSECGAWRNFHDLEECLSLDELVCLYEAALIRQNRAIRATAAAWGGGGDDYEEPSYSGRLKERREGTKKEKKYLSPWLVDPASGGEVTPAFGENEIAVLPINLGYSIMEDNGEGANNDAD
jgi:hypothetical protein